MKNDIVYKTGFSDLARASLANLNTKITFHHRLDFIFTVFPLLHKVRFLQW